jgi:NAD(P)-dependent dehydrogenase (short-subunit alcohol dehydrogenase family)
VTGTSRGIGLGIARCCIGAGLRVLGVSRSGAVHDELGPSYAGVRADVRSPATAEELLGAALNRFGRVDALVNNAGVLATANCWEQDDRDWDEMMSTNLTGPFMLSRRFAAHWARSGAPGTIVNICSLESDRAWASPPQAGYAATKGGLLGLTRSLALALARYRIRVVAIAPGIVESEMTGQDRPAIEARIPLGHRLTMATEIGHAAVWLISDQAAHVTGEMVFVDGGYKLR